MTQQLDDVRPCPICGGLPSIGQCYPWPKGRGTAPWYVGCYDPGHKEDFFGVNGDTKSEAVAKWNAHGNHDLV